MQEKTTLYKIQRDAAAGHSINVVTNGQASENVPHLLFCGGFHSTMQGNKANFLAELAEKNGWAFTRFDYLGHGQSDAQAEDCSLHDWLADTVAVIDSLSDKVILIGSSMGAWLAVHAILQRPDKVSALVTIAAAPDFTEQLLWPALTNDQKFSIQTGQCAVVPSQYDGDDWRVRVSLFESGRELALLNDAEPLDIKIPIRMLHGTADTDVPCSLSQKLLARFAQSPDAALTLVSNGDHRLSDHLGLYQLENALHQLIDDKPH